MKTYKVVTDGRLAQTKPTLTIEAADYLVVSGWLHFGHMRSTQCGDYISDCVASFAPGSWIMVEEIKLLQK